VATLKDLYSWLQIVVVDDGSDDETLQTVRTTLNQFSEISHTVVELSRNVGQSAATAIGLSHARGDVVVTLDDDLQYGIDEIPKLITALSDDMDFVVGAPSTYPNSRSRMLASRLVRWLGNRAFETPTRFVFSPFVCFQQHFLTRVDLRSQPVEQIGWMFSLTKRYVNVAVSTSAGLRSPSNYRLRHLLRIARPALRPLVVVVSRLSRWFAAVVAILGLSLSLRYLYLSVFGDLLPGFPTVAVLLLLNIAICALCFSLVLSMRSQLSLVSRGRPFLVERRVFQYQTDGGI
jgi:glycosyltransferase involved in cell wall biosynthesis